MSFREIRRQVRKLKAQLAVETEAGIEIRRVLINTRDEAIAYSQLAFERGDGEVIKAKMPHAPSQAAMPFLTLVELLGETYPELLARARARLAQPIDKELDEDAE